MSRTPGTISAGVAWDTQLTAVFRLGISQIGGPDVLPGTFGNNVFDDLSANVRSIEISRGRSGDLGSIAEGESTIVLNDPDGIWNPKNPDSPLAGLIKDMRPLRVRETHLGVEKGLFYGFIDTVHHQPNLDERTTTIRAVDLFVWIAGVRPIIASTGVTTVGAAIGLILDAAEWTDPALRSLDTGDSIPDFSADGSKDGLQIIGDLLKTDLGLFFIDGDGVATYLSRNRFYGRADAVDTFGPADLVNVEPMLETRNVVNRQRVTATGGVEQEATNDTSRRARGWRDGSPITSDYLMSDSAALNLAAWIVLVNGDGQTPAREIVIPNSDDTQIARQMAREIGDYVSLSEGAGGTQADGTIVRLSHHIDDAGNHEMALTVAEKRVTVFTIGISTVGSADVLGY